MDVRIWVAFSPAFVAFDAVYRPRHPEESPLYKAVAGHLETFLARQRERDRHVRRVTRTGDQIDPESIDALASPRCSSVAGFSLHANVAVHAGDRERLERLIRYCARPPIAMEDAAGRSCFVRAASVYAAA